MNGPKYAVGEPVPSSGRKPKHARTDLAFSKDLLYRDGVRRTSSGRYTKGTWALHATKGWRKRS